MQRGETVKFGDCFEGNIIKWTSSLGGIQHFIVMNLNQCFNLQTYMVGRIDKDTNVEFIANSIFELMEQR